MKPVERVLEKLNVAASPDSKGEYLAFCPAHDDTKPKPPSAYPPLSSSLPRRTVAARGSKVERLCRHARKGEDEALGLRHHKRQR